ncbi:PREDICTED: peptide-N4-(N-acetyl-beta-glucosaminyl)asparagine amidase A [Tarenaya hassleriana]|uniref:peptide-N4-(N-acetyl-beta- glucosaminyl)asparagine amidase A n=1 Tax=Tarenaya hassleriana TaxID=28532 RepID=UPI00053C760C|nr:PREDICTED: peptide-N4-(N-acetyl-beta-glucosaminyl)asparagine amidase A [Tarenaya hassleriana]
MASFLSPLFCFTLFFLLRSLTAFANLQKTRSPFRPSRFSPLFASETLNVSSPTVYFEVAKPISHLPATQPPCSHHVLRHDFGYTYGKPPVLANYTPPSHCPFRDFSKIVLEFRATCQGRQFDRIFGIWVNGIEILRSCTAEPRATGIIWSVEKDVTRYHSLLVKDETQILAVYMGNLVDKTYTGVYHVDVIFHFYPVEEGVRTNLQNPVSGYGSHADLILPISRNLPLNDGLWFEVMNSTHIEHKEFEIPRNVYRAVLEVYVSFHENDEFWYGNFPDDYIEANNLSAPGNGPFREVVISLDGDIAGAVWPFPVVFTGGINPLLWRPITAIGSFDLPTYDIEITPFLGSLLDGKPHKFGFSVTNALNVWYIDANLHLWLDSERQRVEGELLKLEISSLATIALSDFKGLNGRFKTVANRSLTSAGRIKSSHGDITTTVIQEFGYVNNMVAGKDGNLQIVDQVIMADDRVRAGEHPRKIFKARSLKSFPFFLYSDYLDQGNGTSLSISNVTMAFRERRSERANGLKPFKSYLNNKQDGRGVMVVKDNLVVSGHGRTRQVYRYMGSDQCYFRNVSSSNYTIIYDKVETLCKPRLETRFGSLSLPFPA